MIIDVMKGITMITLYRNIIIGLIMACCVTTAFAQNSSGETNATENNKKAWELGIGANGLQMTRLSIYDFQLNSDGGYIVGADKKDLIFGGNIYAARELNSHFSS
jgi:hypothetical protein